MQCNSIGFDWISSLLQSVTLLSIGFVYWLVVLLDAMGWDGIADSGLRSERCAARLLPKVVSESCR